MRPGLLQPLCSPTIAWHAPLTLKCISKASPTSAAFINPVLAATVILTGQLACDVRRVAINLDLEVSPFDTCVRSGHQRERGMSRLHVFGCCSLVVFTFRMIVWPCRRMSNPERASMQVGLIKFFVWKDMVAISTSHTNSNSEREIRKRDRDRERRKYGEN